MNGVAVNHVYRKVAYFLKERRKGRKWVVDKLKNGVLHHKLDSVEKFFKLRDLVHALLALIYVKSPFPCGLKAALDDVAYIL